MKQRCYNPKNPKYYLYGGKGIKICSEWNDDYDKFKAWSYKNGYTDDLSIDRLDSNLDYCPQNCHWITINENSAKANIGQHKNKSKRGQMLGISPFGEIFEILNVSQFAREHNLNRSSISHRLNKICSNPYYKNWKFIRNSCNDKKCNDYRNDN